MLSQLALTAFLAVTLSSSIVRATPIDIAQDLEKRDNKWNLNCSNAPAIVAGNLVTQADVSLAVAIPSSGSDQTWLKYLWCTVNTKTYTFFNTGPMNPKPGNPQPGYRNVRAALNTGAAVIEDLIAENGGDGPLAGGYWTNRPNDTNIELYIKSSKGTITYSVMHAALTGLALATTNYNPDNDPMLFQINDGESGEVGLGYAGYLEHFDSLGIDQCVYSITPEETRGCEDIPNGWVDHFD